MNQALDLDIHTLSLLLERNYHQHRRCKYYQRMSMVLSSLKQLPSFELVSNQMHELKSLVALLLDDNDGEHQDVDYMVRKRRAKEEEEWTLEQSQTSMKIVSQNKDAHQQQQLQQIIINIQLLKTLTTQSLPITISRIVHATSPILHEISRGYFVPFLTVALGCLGRIHHILHNLGREVVSVLSEVVPQLRVACSKHEMNDDWKMLKNIVSPQFVVEKTKKNLSIKNTSSDASSTTTQEWNSLLTQYLEVSQDSITKQMNEFVKRNRLDNARLRFGIVKSDMQKNVSNDSQKEGDGGDNDGSANDDEMQLPADSINDTSDMGELVSMHKSSGDSSLAQIKSSDGVDPNMARIRQHRESTKTISATDSSSSKKKKRRKKKKKEQPESKVDGTTKDDLFSSSANEEQLPQHEHLNLKAIDTSVTALETTTQDDNSSEGIEVKKRKKSKKKDKKSKKRKKSSSVIDDIFG